MTINQQKFVALLRGINVGGHNKLPMAELRALCAELGWADTRSYIQSGNLVFTAQGTAAELEAVLEQAIEDRFSLTVPAIVRAASAWPPYIDQNPFPHASEQTPNLVMLALSRNPPAADTESRLRERASESERISRTGDALWIHYGDGSGRSKLTPALLDRAAGSPVTTRNWRTVLKLGEMASDSD